MSLRKENVAMRTTDFSPLYRFSVGFDRMQRLVDAASRLDDAAYAYPPYNIEATWVRRAHPYFG